MMEAHEKFTAFFLTVVLLGTGYFIHKHATDKTDCTQSALSQNYSAEQIQKICR